MSSKRTKVAEIELPTPMDSSDLICDVLNTSDKLQELNKDIALLESRLQELRRLKKLLMNSKRVLVKAQSLYYHENKSNDTIITDITARLSSSGLLVMKGEKAVIPWRLVRACTDRDFAALSIVDKKRYINMALGELGVGM